MKKVYKPKISKLFLFIVIIFTVVTVMMFQAYTVKKAPIFILMGVTFAVVGIVYLWPNIFFTKYIFEEQYLTVREWPFRYTRIFYEDVVGFDDNDKKDDVKKAAMSFHSVIISYYNDEDVKSFIEVSPKDFEMFLLVLGSRVKNFSDSEKLRFERIAREKDEKHRRRQKYLDRLDEEKQIADSQVKVIKVKGLAKQKGFKVQSDE